MVTKQLELIVQDVCLNLDRKNTRVFLIYPQNIIL